MYLSFLFLFLILFILLLFCFKKESYHSPPLSKKKYPLYEYEYLNQYFQLYYSSNKEKIQKQMDNFFSNVSIVFISLQRNKERVKNIHSIIQKYNLKNTYLINAIDYLDLKEKNKSYSIEDEGISYTISPISHEKKKEIACSFSHMKAILFGATLKTELIMIVEDDICFDYIPFSKYTIRELYENLPNENSYLSLYTNKPDYKKDIFEFQYAHFSKGYYGAVSYVMNKTILQKFYQYFYQENNKFFLPQIEKTLFIADHYFSSLCDNYHLPSSILLPNNLFITSSLHSEKDKDHILMQYYYLFHLYHRYSFSTIIPKYLILYSSNPFEYWYRFSYPNLTIKKVKTFQEGLSFLEKNGGYFIFSSLDKFIFPKHIPLISVSAYFIISIPNHPYLSWIKEFKSFQYEYNQHLRLPLTIKDYKFIQYPVMEKFIFIIPSYQNEKWVERNLMSIINQTITNWYIYYINDNSSDKTLENVNKMIRTHKIEHKIKIINNKQRKYQAYSRYIAYKNIPGEYILVLLDGDDWLYNEKVLEHIQIQYNKGTLCTYGKAVFFEDGQVKPNKYVTQKSYPRKVIQKNDYRNFDWFNVHLRTCRASLLKNIPVSHLKDKNGQWLQHSTDMAEWFWIVEQSKGNIIFMDKITYVYNRDNSLTHQNSWYYHKDSKEREEVIKRIRNVYDNTY